MWQDRLDCSRIILTTSHLPRIPFKASFPGFRACSIYLYKINSPETLFNILCNHSFPPFLYFKRLYRHDLLGVPHSVMTPLEECCRQSILTAATSRKEPRPPSTPPSAVITRAQHCHPHEETFSAQLRQSMTAAVAVKALAELRPLRALASCAAAPRHPLKAPAAPVTTCAEDHPLPMWRTHQGTLRRPSRSWLAPDNIWPAHPTPRQLQLETG